MENKVISKKNLLVLLKFGFTGLALFLVFNQISWEQISDVLAHSNVFLLILAVVFFATSKVIGAYRLLGFFKCIGLDLSFLYNLKLYWIGMFYNFFLPGGIGGDGYKIYLLKKEYGASTKLLVKSSLIDRISGLASLLFLAGIGFNLLSNDLRTDLVPDWFLYVSVTGLVIVFPATYFFAKVLLRQFSTFITKAFLLSVGVQLMQVLSVFCILSAVGVNDDELAYCVLFLISSFISILPFTIGGVGSREVTFLFGYEYFGIDGTVSVVLGLLFTLITALVSFGSIFFRLRHHIEKS